MRLQGVWKGGELECGGNGALTGHDEALAIEAFAIFHAGAPASGNVEGVLSFGRHSECCQ